MDVVPDSHKPLFKMLNPILDLARPYFAPPNVPADRTAILRDAFGKLVDDQQFRADMQKVAGITPSLVRGEEMMANIKEMLDQPPEEGYRTTADSLWRKGTHGQTSMIDAAAALERRSSHFCFSFVRNPFDRLVSAYNNKLVDVRDIPSGTLVQDPTYPASEKKYFRVP
jgi:hypothetical protein